MNAIADSIWCLLEHIDHTEPGESHNLWFSMGFDISLFSFIGSYYTYGVTPPYSVFDEYSGSLTSTLVSLDGVFVYCVYCVSPNAALLIIRYL